MLRNAVRLAGLGAVLAALVCGTAFAIRVNAAATPPPATVQGLEQMLGIALPAGTSSVRLDFRPHRFGEYESFASFRIEPGELDALFAEAAFQPRLNSRGPLAQVATATHGGLPMDQFVRRNRPAWWRPTGSSFVLAQRSPPGHAASFTGPNMSWYIVDTSVSDRLVVYVFAVEV